MIVYSSRLYKTALNSLIIFPVIFKTIITAQMMFVGDGTANGRCRGRDGHDLG